MSDDLDPRLEALLRGKNDQLPPPADLWDDVRRRARRRRTGKALLAVAAGVAVIAGAVPAVIAVRHNSDNDRIQVANPPSSFVPLTAPARKGGASIQTSPATLERLQPRTISFVSQTSGWVSGDTRVAGGTVAGGLGRTTDGGTSWSAEVASPPPTGMVRFANADIGFSFGSAYQITHDGGATWSTLPSPGNIIDLETMHDRVWALVQSCEQCRAPRLFTATLDSPTLRRVRTVAPVGPYDSAIVLNADSVYVTGGQDLWLSRDGQYWRKGINPCGAGPQSFSAWSPTDLAAECTPVRGVGSLFESNDGGLHWSNIANLPEVTAATATLSAGTWNHLVITTGVGAPYVTFDDGQHWRHAATGSGPVTFAAYISTTHIVGIRGGRRPAFLSSDDAGRHWTATPFAG
jgi:photosystem II stability/assembly factor-like uncharacterized protein